MKPSFVRRLALVYPLLLLVCGLGYARYSSYALDGDAVAFMDISDALRSHHLPLAINGYWNPAYAAALALGAAISHPTRTTELQTFYWVNFFIFLGCIAACIFFVRGMVVLREQTSAPDAPPPALTLYPLLLACLAILFYSFQRELALGDVRADALLLCFFLLAAGVLLRIQAGGRLLLYPLLGLILGLAYLTKSFAFLPSGVLLAGIFLYGLSRTSASSGAASRSRVLTGAILAGLVFVAIAGPYIFAISKQRGRPTTGESARLNYAFFIDRTGRWHEWHSHDLGHATADFKHHEQLLLDTPPVYSFDQHPVGTYPLWFDPAYWTDTIQPHVWLKGQLIRFARCSALLLRYGLGHLEPLVLLAVLLLAGFRFSRRSSWLPLVPVSVWGLTMIGIYFPVDIQDRYMTGAYLLFLLPLLAMLRRPSPASASEPVRTTELATMAVVLLSLLALADATADIASRRRLLSAAGSPSGAYSLDIYDAAKGLGQLGIVPGETVACFGNKACYEDQYWARLAGTPIRAEIEVPDGSNPAAFWASQTTQPQIVSALEAHHIAAIVASFTPAAEIPAGWHHLGVGNFYAYPLGSGRR